MKNLIFLFGLFLLLSCNASQESGDSTGEAFNADEYTFESLKDSDVEKVTKYDDKGKKVEQGFIKNGEKTGQWVEYDPNKGTIKAITSYIDGKLNGLYIEFDNLGYKTIVAEFKDDDLNGKYIKYKYNKKLEEANYKNGKLNGVRIKYDKSSGKKLEEIEYKDDVIDGKVKYYNDKGEVVLEYVYKNGKKVEGGMVKPAGENPPR